MGTIWVREFTGGLDTRRLEEALAGGTLIRATNCHIGRGGDIEERAAFVPAFALPMGTVSLAAGAAGLFVFGSGPAPGALPAGVTYQQLEHPDGTAQLTKVLSYDLYAGKLYVVGLFADGTRHHFYDGTVVPDWFDGRSRATFSVINGAGGDDVTSITVGGIELLGAPVTWAGDTETTAAAIAAEINSNVSSPEYDAVATGNIVAIVADAVGPAANGLTVAITATGALAFDPPTTTMASGATPSGTFLPGTFVKTLGRRVCSVSDSNLHGSGLNEPTKWTTDATGAFFVDLSKEASGAETMLAMAEYQSLLAIFGERVILLYVVDADPANNRKSQALYNTGTFAPRSVVQFGDRDVYYLDGSGYRSLRARDSINIAVTSDIGSAIDPLITQDLAALTIDERAAAISLIEPGEGRLWLCIGTKIYVFSYFTATKISAWSTYTPGFWIDDACVFRRKVYLRSGDTIYVYGGAGSTLQYDDTEPEVWLPYLHADKPAAQKAWKGFDAICRGEWEVRAGMEPRDLSVSDLIARINGTTVSDHTQPLEGRSTHISLRFRGLGGGERPAKLASCVVHFESDADED